MFNKQERKEVRTGIWQTFGFWVMIVVLFGGFGFLANSLGFWRATAVERIVVKESFQYKEGMAQQAAIWESQLVELDEQLSTCIEDCEGIQGQKRIIKARLRAVTINQ